MRHPLPLLLLTTSLLGCDSYFGLLLQPPEGEIRMRSASYRPLELAYPLRSFQEDVRADLPLEAWQRLESAFSHGAEGRWEEATDQALISLSAKGGMEAAWFVARCLPHLSEDKRGRAMTTLAALWMETGGLPWPLLVNTLALVHQGRWTEARVEADKLRSESPLAGHLARAFLLLRERSPERVDRSAAVALLREALEGSEALPLYWLLLEVYLTAGDCASASPLLEQYLSLVPRSASAALYGATCAFLGDRPARAEELAELATRQAPGDPYTYIIMGAALAQQNRGLDGLGALERSLAIADSGVARLHEGWAYLSGGKISPALEAFGRAREDEASALWARLGEAQALVLDRKGREGRDRLAEILRLAPAFWPARVSVALLSDPMNSEGRQRMIEIRRPRPDEALALQASLYLDGGFPDLAMDRLAGALTLNPRCGPALAQKVRLLFETAKASEAIRVGQQGREAKVGDPDLLVNLAVALVNAKALEEAAAVLSEALTLAPDAPDLHRARAIILFLAGRASEARKHYGPAGLDPGPLTAPAPYALTTLAILATGVILLRRRRKAKARRR